MCDPVTAAIGLAAVGGSMAIAKSQNAAAGRHYNVEVAQQNALLNKEFQDKQKMITSNQNTQNSEFDQMTDAQKKAFGEVTDLANQKSGVVQDAVSAPGNAFTGTNSNVFANSVMDRNARTASAEAAPTAYSPTGASGDIASHVLSAMAADQQAKRAAVTGGVTNAQAQMGALSDTGQAQGQLFRNIDLGMNDIARKATNVNNTLISTERLPQEQINQQNQVNADLLGQPLFRGAEPMYRAPNTAIADLMGSAGKAVLFGAGQKAGAQGAGNYFGTSTQAQPWVNPGTVANPTPGTGANLWTDPDTGLTYAT